MKLIWKRYRAGSRYCCSFPSQDQSEDVGEASGRRFRKTRLRIVISAIPRGRLPWNRSNPAKWLRRILPNSSHPSRGCQQVRCEHRLRNDCECDRQEITMAHDTAHRAEHARGAIENVAMFLARIGRTLDTGHPFKATRMFLGVSRLHTHVLCGSGVRCHRHEQMSRLVGATLNLTHDGQVSGNALPCWKLTCRELIKHSFVQSCFMRGHGDVECHMGIFESGARFQLWRHAGLTWSVAGSIKRQRMARNGSSINTFRCKPAVIDTPTSHAPHSSIFRSPEKMSAKATGQFQGKGRETQGDQVSEAIFKCTSTRESNQNQTGSSLKASTGQHPPTTDRNSSSNKPGEKLKYVMQSWMKQPSKDDPWSTLSELKKDFNK